jgi:ubiquinone biosynthesis protein UbiJ
MDAVRDLQGLALKPVSALLNHGIARSATARATAQALEGQSLGIVIEGTGVEVRLAASGGAIALEPLGAAACTVTLSGPPLGLLRLFNEDPQAVVRAGAVRLDGDTTVADRFRELLQAARPDLEEQLSRLFGDAAAHQLGAATREIFAWGQRAVHSVARSSAEYFSEERRTLATPVEVREFCADVDALANDVARAEARLAQLKARP